MKLLTGGAWKPEKLFHPYRADVKPSQSLGIMYKLTKHGTSSPMKVLPSTLRGNWSSHWWVGELGRSGMMPNVPANTVTISGIKALKPSSPPNRGVQV